MEHVLMLKVETVLPGDNYKTKTWIELGDIAIDSPARIQEVAEKVGEKMGYDNCRFEPKKGYPESESFFLYYDILPSDWNPYGVEEKIITESFWVKTYSCLKIHGKLFKLKPFEQN